MVKEEADEMLHADGGRWWAALLTAQPLSNCLNKQCSSVAFFLIGAQGLHNICAVTPSSFFSLYLSCSAAWTSTNFGRSAFHGNPQIICVAASDLCTTGVMHDAVARHHLCWTAEVLMLSCCHGGQSKGPTWSSALSAKIMPACLRRAPFSIMCLLESQEAAFFIPGSQRGKIFLLFKSGEVVWHGQLLGLSVCGRFYKNSTKTWGCLLAHDKSSSNDGITLSYGLCMLQLAFVKVTSLSAILSWLSRKLDCCPQIQIGVIHLGWLP